MNSATERLRCAVILHIEICYLNVPMFVYKRVTTLEICIFKFECRLFMTI